MKHWYSLSIEETQKALIDRGKSSHPNRLDDLDVLRWYSLLAKQFTNLLILVLIAATIVSFFLGDLIDAIAILVIVIFNGFLGFLQEWKAESTIKSLQKMLAPRCRVIRNGEEQMILSEHLVPGDCVVLSTGNAVPADMRLTHVTHLMTDESTLTGESLPVIKSVAVLPKNTPLTEQNNMVFMGTHVINGFARGLVVETGMNTQFGLIAKLTRSATETKTRLQIQLTKLARQLGIVALSISGIVIVIGTLSGKELLKMIMTGVSLAVSAIPEGLPAVVTVTLALGVRAMARKNALLRRLEAAETLGAVSIICTDKTGTLTKNEMTVEKIALAQGVIDVSGAGFDPQGQFLRNGRPFDPQTCGNLMALIESGRQCNHAHIKKIKQRWHIIGSPDEAALIVLAEKAGLKQEDEYPIVAEFSFSSDRKRMSIVKETEQGRIVHVKGAPEVILKLCSHLMTSNKVTQFSPEQLKQIEQAYRDFANLGFRTLALAYKELPLQGDIDENEIETELTFLGIVAISDPPRPEVSGAVSIAQKAGIRVIMITGDSPITAKVIANQIGLKIEKAITSKEIDELNDTELGLLLKMNILFARTLPKDKLRIVRLLQKQGQLIAMTGDGVNDAPALKQADVGLAMGLRGTDVARSAADIILTDDNFASIVDAIEEGRRQYANIRKFVLYLTSSNMGEVISILINIFVGGPLILIPIQILWINLVTDSATAISLSVEKGEKNIMHEPPRKINQPILNSISFLLLTLFGAYIGIAAFLLYAFYLPQSYILANTMAFTAIVVMANIHVLNFRNLNGTINRIGWFSNKWLLIAIVLMLTLQGIALYTPTLQRLLHVTSLSFTELGIIVLVSLPLFIVPELYKWIRYRK